MQRGEGGRRRWLVGHQGQHTVADHTDMGHSGSIVWTEVVAALLLFLFVTSSWSPRFSRSFHFEKDHVSRLGKTEMSCQVQILSTECQARHVRG